MSYFTSSENSKLLWDILNENPLFIKFTQNRSDMIYSVFEDDIANFYEKNKNVNNLLELNKMFITYITEALVAKDNSKKKVQFKDSFNAKKEEFMRAFTIETPSPIDFSDVKTDEKLTNMDELIHNEISKRQFEIKKIEDENDILTRRNKDKVVPENDISIKNSETERINQETFSSFNNIDKRLLRIEEKMENLSKLMVQLLHYVNTKPVDFIVENDNSELNQI